ncbi:MAG: glycosyltransferase, partial [Phycisphaerae bacterium]|nr:glycosyltransferase [Phycisphaerae bacterium]
PIMEDYDLVRRLRARGRVLTAREAIQTSARRWQKRGTLRTTLINTLMLAGFNAGVAPASLARFYRGPAAS